MVCRVGSDLRMPYLMIYFCLQGLAMDFVE